MKTHKRLLVLWFTALVVAVFAWSAAGQHTYTEDFKTVEFKNQFRTTAVWDTLAGEIRLWPFELSLAGSYDTPGDAYNVVINGDYAYVADYGAGLQVIDISDPTNPSLAGDYDTPGNASDLAIAGDYAYVADFSGGLQVLDISDPSNPSLAGSDGTPSDAWSVAISGDYLYLAIGVTGLFVFGIEDPTNPSFVGSYNTPGAAFDVVVSGDHAYVADAHSGLQVFDISDPTNPSLAGSYDTPDLARALTISGDNVYIADRYSGLQVIDVSDPTNPSLAGSYNTIGGAQGVSVSGDYAYVADFDSGLQVIDISDPTNPSISGDYDTPGVAIGVAVSGEHAFVADEGSGLQVIDICDPTIPTVIASAVAPGYAQDIAVSGDHAYVANLALFLQVIDISDPTVPVMTGSYYLPVGYADVVSVSGDHAFIATRDSVLAVVDIGDPTSPSFAGSYVMQGPGRDVAISGDYAYVAVSQSGLQVVDINDPATPSSAGIYDTPDNAYAVAVSGDNAYVADGNSGLQVINISDPTNPSQITSLETGGYALAIAVSGDYAYVGAGSDGLQVIDISDNSSLSLVGSYDTPGFARDVAISGDYAFVADSDSGLHVVDISDPTNPSSLGRSYQSGKPWRVVVSGDYSYTEGGPLGFGFQVNWILQRSFIAADNTAQSGWVNLSNTDYNIGAVRLTTTQTDSVRWEVRTSNSNDWTQVSADASWNEMPVPGRYLYWRTTHVYSQPRVNPACSNLKIDWVYTHALIDSITDIPNDQGRQVRITWMKCGYDYVGSSIPVTEYSIYRRIDHALTAQAEADGKKDLSVPRPFHVPAYPPGDWDFIMNVPARAEDSYSVVVPTLADSTVTEGMYHTAFFVSTLTGTPGVYYDSPVDSGYSVDNLDPAVPQGFRVAYNSGGGTDLVWEECPDVDFQYFCIYRGESEDFTPGPGNLVHTTTGTSWRDEVAEGYKYRYKVTSVDFSGNESDPTEEKTTTDVDETPNPKRFALYQNVPNPFNPTTTISYDVPVAGARVAVQVFDVNGRLVKTLVDQNQTAGRKSVMWDGTDQRKQSVATGVYFCRMTSGNFTRVRKMILMK